MKNKNIIEKADMTLADLAAGGLLNPEQTDQFIRDLQVQPTLLAQSRVVPMSSPQKNIDKIGFGQRILKPAVSGTPLDAADRSKPATGQVQLNTTEVIAEVRLPYDVIEDNIEQANRNLGTDQANNSGAPVSGSFKDTIMAMITERVALDLEELALLGDTASGDAYLALLDGFLVQATSHVVDNNGNGCNKDLFKAGLKSLPKQFHRNLPALKNFVSIANEIDYRDTIADRQTQLGDAQIEGFRGAYAYGVPIEKTALMPEEEGLLTIPKNMIMGIQRKVSLEVDKDISSRVFIIVVTARIDFKLEEEDADRKSVV